MKLQTNKMLQKALLFSSFNEGLDLVASRRGRSFTSEAHNQSCYYCTLTTYNKTRIFLYWVTTQNSFFLVLKLINPDIR